MPSHKVGSIWLAADMVSIHNDEVSIGNTINVWSSLNVEHGWLIGDLTCPGFVSCFANPNHEFDPLPIVNSCITKNY